MTDRTAPSWNLDLEGIVTALRQANPAIDLRGTPDTAIRDLIRHLPAQAPAADQLTPGDLEAIRAMSHWGI